MSAGKHFLLFAALLSLAACGSGNPKPVIPKGQIIVLSDTILHTGGADTVCFGRLRSGETAVKQLLLHNTSGRPVAVVSYTRTCGCTTFEFDSQPILPDSLRPVRLTFDSQGLVGWQFKLLEVELAGAAAPLKIHVDAEVE